MCVPALHFLCQVTMGKWPYLSLFPHLKKWPIHCSIGWFSQSLDCCTETFVSWVPYPMLVTVSKARHHPAPHSASHAAWGGGREAAALGIETAADVVGGTCVACEDIVESGL